jgi:general stress protein YciG
MSFLIELICGAPYTIQTLAKLLMHITNYLKEVSMTRGLGSPSMDEAKKKAIQSEGGKKSPQNFKKNRDLASKAGKVGGSR